MNILYVTHELPFPTVAGHHLRSMEILNALPPSAAVHIIGFSEMPVPSDAGPERATYDAVPGHIRIRGHPIKLAKAIAASLRTRLPYSIVKYPKTRMSAVIADHCERARPEVVITSLFTRQFIPAGPWKIILDSHNIEHELWQSFEPYLSPLKASFVRREARLLQHTEHQAWRSADGIIAISQEDAATLQAAAPATPVEHIPPRITVPPQARGTSDKRPAFDVGLIGVWSWAPNALAIKDFEKTIMPTLAKAGLRVLVAGKGLDTATAARLREWGAECPGYLDDISTFYDAIRLVAAPYSVGGGVRMKVTEALSWGKPVIGTALAYRGIAPVIPDGWIVPDNDALAAALVRYAANPPDVPAGLSQSHSAQAQRRAMSRLIQRSNPRKAAL